MQSKVKVLQYFWGKLDAGGGETFVVNLFEKMDKERYDVDFLVYEDREYFYSDKVFKLGGRVVALSSKEPRFILVRLIKRWCKLYKYLKENAYDVFHCNCDFSLKFVEMYIAKKAGVKKRVCHSHSTSLDRKTLKEKCAHCVHILCRPLLVKYSTDLIACSEGAAEWLYGKTTRNVLVMKNGIDVDKYGYDLDIRNEYRRKLDISNEIVIGTVGRCVAVKNQKFLIDIIKNAKEKEKAVILVLIGDGILKQELAEYAERENVSALIRFVGLTDKVNEYLMAMDCYVMSSLYEGLPVSAIEAQATGLPCIVSNTITRELDVTGNVFFYDLKKGSDYWLEGILDIVEKFRRKDERGLIIQAGYNSRDVVELIQNIYVG